MTGSAGDQRSSVGGAQVECQRTLLFGRHDHGLCIVRRAQAALGIVGEGDGFLRDAEEIRVQDTIAILIVKGTDGERLVRQSGEVDPGGERAWVDFGRQAPGRGFEKRLLRRPDGDNDLAPGVSQAGDDDLQLRRAEAREERKHDEQVEQVFHVVKSFSAGAVLAWISGPSPGG